MKDRTAIIFCIGRELLEGQVLDRNANFMASNVTQLGFRVRTIQVLDDVEADMVAAFRAAIAEKPAYVITTGGMGPGLSDITRACAATAAELPLVEDATAKTYLANSYRRLMAKGIVDDAELTEERCVMAKLPKGSTCFENIGGTAPAVSLLVGETRFFLLPGAPEEMRRLFTDFVASTLEKDGPGEFRDAVHVEFPGGDEALVSRMVGSLARRHPTVATRARLQGSGGRPVVRITLSVEGSDKDTLRSQLDAASADLRARLGLEISQASADEQNSE